MHAHPRVEQQPISAAPCGVALDRREGIPLLPARPNGCDQRSEAVTAREVAHRFHRDCAQAPALEIARHHDHERAERVRAALVEAARDRTVDARGQIADGPVPAQREGAGAGEDLVLFADEVELKLRALFGEAPQ